ncbi:MAG: arsenate reductase [Flavobacteriaceae bacterium]|nr:MAG: arsenate reductase [Flavobacteriaceae bacterium]
MNKVYFLSSCDTCKKIMNQFDLSSFEKREIKSQPLNRQELEALRSLGGSYQSLFSKRAKKYSQLGLKDQNLSEEDYLFYLLEDYTFLQRPVFVVGDKIWIGNSKTTLDELKQTLTPSKK